MAGTCNDRSFTAEELNNLFHLAQLSLERLGISGGGARGIVLGGAYRALVETGVFQNLKVIAGTSAGALTGGLMAAGVKPLDLREELLNASIKTYLGEKVGHFFGSNPPGVSFMTHDGLPLLEYMRRNIISGIQSALAELDNLDALCDENPDLDRIVKKIYSDKPRITFKDLSVLAETFPNYFKKLITTAIRFSDGKLTIFDENNTPDVEVALACRASASIPILFEPVEIEIDGKIARYVDGGLIENIPTDYFDLENGTYVENKKKAQTLVMAFSDGLDNAYNGLFQALYGKEKIPLDALPFSDWLESISVNYMINKLSGLNLTYDHMERKQLDFEKLRREYPQRTLELRVSHIKTSDFDKASEHARLMDAFGFLDTVSYITNHGLHDVSIFDEKRFYTEIVFYYEHILHALQKGTSFDPEEYLLTQKLNALKHHLKSEKLSEDKIAREIYYHIKETAEKHLSSRAAFALSRAVELHTGQINAETLFKETYLEAFKRTAPPKVSKLAGQSIFCHDQLSEMLQHYNMFHLYLSQPHHEAESRTDIVFQNLSAIDAVQQAYLQEKAHVDSGADIKLPPQIDNFKSSFILLCGAGLCGSIALLALSIAVLAVIGMVTTVSAGSALLASSVCGIAGFGLFKAGTYVKMPDSPLEDPQQDFYTEAYQ